MHTATDEPAHPRCAHCGAPVPSGSSSVSGVGAARSDELLFCCSGCRLVHSMLTSAGLTDYYSYSARVGAERLPVSEVEKGAFADFDSAAYQRLYCQLDEQGVGHTELALEGVHCAACVWLVERLPRLEPAVVSARLDLARRIVDVSWRTESAGGTSLGNVARALARIGYRPSPVRSGMAKKQRARELRSLLVRMGIAGASAGNVMLIALALYSGGVGGFGGVGRAVGAPAMDEATQRFFEWASLVVSLPALFAGSVFFRGAFAALRTRVPHMDLPIAIGISVAYGWGAFSVVTGTFDVYFDTITTLVFALLVGRYLKTKHEMGATEALELVHAVTPLSSVRKEADGSRTTVPTESLEAGARVIVSSGDVLPVDGVVLSGRSSLDRSILSGESLPVNVAPGDVVEAGCVNVGAELIIEATSGGLDTRVGRLLRDVERALSRRTPLLAAADRMAGWFTILVLGVAVSAALLALPHGVPVAVERSLAILIVACPCALGMATPLALSVAVAKAARTGKLVFGASALEAFARPVTLVFDKTGTLTEGRLAVVARDGQRSFDAAFSALESQSRHPVARALLDALAGSKEDAHVGDVREYLGRGISGLVDGKRVALGAPSFVASQLDEPRTESRPDARGSDLDGASVVWGAVDGELVARFWIADKLRGDARQALEGLAALGHRLVLSSGDQSAPVEAVRRELESNGGPRFSEVLAEVTPEAKLAYVERLVREGKLVVMVGDGVNDAGALAVATMGIAVSGAAEASRLAAGVFLRQSGVGEVLELARGSRRTLRVIYRGIGLSLGYNVLGVSLAMSGLLNPLVAAVLMPLSSITVVAHALRSRTFEPEPARREKSRVLTLDAPAEATA